MIARMRKAFHGLVTVDGMGKRFVKSLLYVLGFLTLLTLTGCKEQFIGMLNPKGLIAYQERKLFFDTLALMLIVVLPVIVMSLVFVFHYQVSHRVRDYKPNWSHSYFLETIWWAIPCVIIIILAILTWQKTHELDPYQPIAGHDQPLLVQAIALPWKWIFIYPELNIATVNDLEIPVGRQVEFWITADNAPMSAIFIPQLGSQIYAMAGMRTRLHLVANEIGRYDGMNTQYNGDGFSDMHFTVNVITPEAMQQWTDNMKKTAKPLTDEMYIALLKPSIKDKPQYFAGVNKDLFNHVVNLYMHTFGTIHPRDTQAKFRGE